MLPVAATPSIKVIKEFDYRGSVKRFSNRYHFNGGVPGDPTEWNTLGEAVTDDEQVIYGDNVTIVGWAGYVAGSDAPVASGTVSKVGTFDSTGGTGVPGDCAALIRFSTTARTSKNHPVYLFNYYHGCYRSNAGSEDELLSTQADAIDEYGADWMTGFSDGAHTLVRAGPNGATAVSRDVSALITHRDFVR